MGSKRLTLFTSRTQGTCGTAVYSLWLQLTLAASKNSAIMTWPGLKHPPAGHLVLGVLPSDAISVKDLLVDQQLAYLVQLE